MALLQVSSDTCDSCGRSPRNNRPRASGATCGSCLEVLGLCKGAAIDGFGVPPLARQKLVLRAIHLFEPFYREEAVPFGLDEIVFALPLPGQWNDLALTVTPKGIEIAFAGQNRVIPADRLAAGTLRPAGHCPAPFFELNPRGGLGFSVSHGTASFRNVVVEPLPEND